MTQSTNSTVTVAIAGNPNVGKTTIFNALTGSRHRVGNYPGVTIERTIGTLSVEGFEDAQLVDIPGAFSLNAQSPDEEIAYNVLVGNYDDMERPQVVVVVVNASNLSRNLYFASQILDFPVQVVVALNMTDIALSEGRAIDTEQLQKELGVPVVPMVASRGQGFDDLRREIRKALDAPKAKNGRTDLWRDNIREDVLREVNHLRDDLQGNHDVGPEVADPTAMWLLSSKEHGRNIATLGEAVVKSVDATSQQIRLHLNDENQSPAEHLVEARYKWIWSVVLKVTGQSVPTNGETLTHKVDRVLLHPIAGTAIFLAVMLLVFQALFAWADPLIGLVESLLGVVTGVVEGVLPTGILQDLIVNGVLAGVGNVLVFLPQILILFLFLALLEESGYMARAAVLSEGLMRRVGLHGKSFIPLISGFACAIPGVMATRTIEKREDRLVTIMVLPLVSCAARLPVYALIIGLLFSAYPPLLGFISVGGLVMAGMYFFSIAAVLLVACVLKRTVVKSPKPTMVLDLPPYQRPRLMSIIRILGDRAWVFISEAGTVILALTILMWVLFSFPRVPEGQATQASAGAVNESVARFQDEAGDILRQRGLPAETSTPGLQAWFERLDIVDAQLASMGGLMQVAESEDMQLIVEYLQPALRQLGEEHPQYSGVGLTLWRMRQEAGITGSGTGEAASTPTVTQSEYSIAGRIGKAAEPILQPLGFDWKMGVAIIASFAAREVFVSSLGVVYGLENEVDEESPSLRNAMLRDTYADGTPVYTPLVGLSLLIFFVLACQCMSTLAVIYRETKSWKWPVFVFVYMTILAYVASLGFYQTGRFLGFGA